MVYDGLSIRGVSGVHISVVMFKKGRICGLGGVPFKYTIHTNVFKQLLQVDDSLVSDYIPNVVRHRERLLSQICLLWKVMAG